MFFAGGEQKQSSTPNQQSSEYVANSVEIDARRATAMSAYKEVGFDINRTSDYMRGIDFSKPVDLVILPQGTEVVQYMFPGQKNLGIILLRLVQLEIKLAYIHPDACQ